MGLMIFDTSRNPSSELLDLNLPTAQIPHCYPTIVVPKDRGVGIIRLQASFVHMKLRPTLDAPCIVMTSPPCSSVVSLASRRPCPHNVAHFSLGSRPMSNASPSARPRSPSTRAAFPSGPFALLIQLPELSPSFEPPFLHNPLLSFVHPPSGVSSQGEAHRAQFTLSDTSSSTTL